MNRNDPLNQSSLVMTPQNIHKIFIPQNYSFFLKTPQIIEILDFEPLKMTRPYV